MSSNESEQPPKKDEKSSEEDWGDAWGGDEPQAPTAGSVPQAAETQAEQPPLPEGIEDFKAASSQAPPAEAGVRAKPMRPKQERARMSMEKRASEQTSIEDKEWGQPTVFSARWTSLITFAVLALIIVCLVLMQQSGPPTKAGSGNVQKQQRQKAVEAIEAEIKELNGREKEARKLYADFASAQVIEDILPMIRNSAELGDLIRRTGHQPIVDSEWEPRNQAQWTMNLMGAKPYAILSGELPDFTNFRAYYVLENDLLLLDWKATTGYSTASFEEMALGEGDASEVRGHVKPAALYYGDYTEDGYQCYQIVSPDKRHVLWCYVKRSSDEAKQLGKFFLKGEIIEQRKTEMPMTLKLSRQEGKSMPNQWLIDGLLHAEWINIP